MGEQCFPPGRRPARQVTNSGKDTAGASGIATTAQSVVGPYLSGILLALDENGIVWRDCAATESHDRTSPLA